MAQKKVNAVSSRTMSSRKVTGDSGEETMLWAASSPREGLHWGQLAICVIFFCKESAGCPTTETTTQTQCSITNEITLTLSIKSISSLHGN